jgi:hypothetical protein
MTWLTRVPATVTEAQAVLAHANPDPLEPLAEDYRDHVLTTTSGGVAHRGPQAQRSVNKPWLQQREAEAQAFQKLCRTALAGATDAQQALTTCAHGWQATSVHAGTIDPRPRYGKRGRPGHATAPAQVVSQLTGALTSSLAAHEARIAPPSCFILATNELDEPRLAPQALLAGYQGPQRVDRGVRFLNDPRFLASSRSRKKPERIMALLMVMTVCLLGYAALEDRLRTALKDQDATCPDQQGPPVQTPTARWVFQDFVGIHLLRMRGEAACGLTLNDQPRHLLRRLGPAYEAFYS